jgi:hypothetical protein
MHARLGRGLDQHVEGAFQCLQVARVAHVSMHEAHAQRTKLRHVQLGAAATQVVKRDNLVPA